MWIISTFTGCGPIWIQRLILFPPPRELKRVREEEETEQESRCQTIAEEDYLYATITRSRGSDRSSQKTVIGTKVMKFQILLNCKLCQKTGPKWAETVERTNFPEREEIPSRTEGIANKRLAMALRVVPAKMILTTRPIGAWGTLLHPIAQNVIEENLVCFRSVSV